mgnify:CR=1 FL=1
MDDLDVVNERIVATLHASRRAADAAAAALRADKNFAKAWSGVSANELYVLLCEYKRDDEDAFAALLPETRRLVDLFTQAYLAYDRASMKLAGMINTRNEQES